MTKKTGEFQPQMTIVGGQPSERHKFSEKIQVPVGIEKILFRAASESAFFESLMKDRQGAIEKSGVTLRPSEAGMLSAISNDALSTMVRGIVPKNPKRRRFMGLVATAAATLAIGTAEIGCESAGAGGDYPAGTGPDTGTDADTDTNTDSDSDSDTDTDQDAGPDGST